jgi:hypothetical protein
MCRRFAFQGRAFERRGAKKQRLSLCTIVDQQETTMIASFKAPITLAFTLSITLFALPALGASTHKVAAKPAQNWVSDFANAQAFVTPAKHVWPAAETDGLSREAGECSRGGCIDH